WNREGRYQGQEDIPLSDTGVKQALRLGERLRDVRVDRAVASPLGRAYHTARRALGDGRADTIAVDQGLRAIAHGTGGAKLAAGSRESNPERLAAWRDTPDKVQMPGGESLKAVLERAWPAFCAACDGLGPDDTLFVVSHDAVNRVLLCRVLGLPLFRLWTFRQAPATLNLLEGPDPNHLELVRLNDCAHHTLLFGEAVHRAL